MSNRPGLVMGWREPWRTVRLKSLLPWFMMCSGYLGCGSMPNTVVKTLFSIVEDLPQNKMEKGSNAKIQIGWHCYNQNDLLNTNWSCCPLLQFFSGFQWPVGCKVQIPLQVFQPFTSAPVAQFSLVIHESPPTVHSRQVNYLIEVLSTHTSIVCTHCDFCLEWLSLACSLNGLLFFLQ